MTSPECFFSLDPRSYTLHVNSPDDSLPFVKGAPFFAFYWQNGRLYRLPEQPPKSSVGEWQPVPSPLGSLLAVSHHFAPDRQGVVLTITLATCADRPLFFWKLAIENQGKLPITVDHFALMQVALSDMGLDVAEDLAFHANGWQSWSHTATYGAAQKQRQSVLGPLQCPMVYNDSTPRLRGRGHFSSDFFAVLGSRRKRTALLTGFLSQQQQFGSVVANLKSTGRLHLIASGDHARLDPGCTMETDWAVLFPFHVDQPDALAPYFQAVADWHQVRFPANPPTGWCSWYHFYTKVTAEDIRQNLQAIVSLRDELPLPLVQIDDGFEAAVGDWFDFRPTFPAGVAVLADEIKAAGQTPGLWLAPFILESNSRLAREHPGWLLRDTRGRRVNAGFVWNNLAAALDITVPDALDYACRAVSTAAHDWGFPYLKLDFLYAAALSGRYSDPTRTRAQVLRNGLEALRQAAGPDTFLLGCGMPLGSGLGLFEANRIGADVSGSWKPNWNGIYPVFENEPNVPSARVALQNIITRAPMHRHWWLNDPDCLLVRPDTKLTLPEVQTLASAIALTGGSLLVSDDLPRLPADRRRIAEVLLPAIGERAWVLDWLDAETPARLRVDLGGPGGAWHLLGWFNWGDSPTLFNWQPEAYQLPPGTYWLRSFWDGGVIQAPAGEPPIFPAVPPHGALVLAVRPVTGAPQYLGSDLHLSMGLELSEWHATPQSVSLGLELPRHCAGVVDLALPQPPISPAAQCIAPGVYRFPVKTAPTARLDVRWAG
ncbi:MAG TPA: alpha-galactosidase [Anaerolineaceae bacterium]|nr:alpha-galactosidase [Anaerolineaceae bacterium]